MGQKIIMGNCRYRAPEPITVAHKLDKFESGETTLDNWLKKKALANQHKGASRCFVLCEAKNENVIGYYSLSAGAIAHEARPKAMRRNMPDPLPVLLLGRLAIARDHQGKGLGSALLRDAMLRAVTVSAQTGIFAILVHALSEDAKKFYFSRGFVQSPLQSMTLMMIMKTIRAVLAQ